MNLHMLPWVEEESSPCKNGRSNGEMLEAVFILEHRLEPLNASELHKCACDTQNTCIGVWQIRKRKPSAEHVNANLLLDLLRGELALLQETQVRKGCLVGVGDVVADLILLLVPNPPCFLIQNWLWLGPFLHVLNKLCSFLSQHSAHFFRVSLQQVLELVSISDVLDRTPSCHFREDVAHQAHSLRRRELEAPIPCVAIKISRKNDVHLINEAGAIGKLTL
mmetsp:Transcript_5314/g.12206  ORF Transcript_5314/g.12206 Transcript_5314/m.12206 type:complete len:221 (-) Transcript_5314:1067-1729(-)